ncbi:Glycosyltransferase family 15 protein [Mycena chlorophos]|uniref:Glycosyltransferase family 15 protein n=1 Tax=Mycena chlorophos TaxID=658473 RepID=A0A8H6ST68_MYCCL|nr:Glycosyltransferase family 15 protein [Mycena chlorophos]
MHTAPRYFLVVLAIVVSVHYILSFTHDGYGRATSISRFMRPRPDNTVPDEYYTNHLMNSSLHIASRGRANATFVILARNSDLENTVRSIRRIEDRFNTRHHYPFVLLNDEPFTDEFKRRVSAVVSGQIMYGQVPREHWVQPDWIDEDLATKGRDALVADNVIYGGSVSYRNMCRFNSGFFFKHPLMEQFRWYWRIEPDVHFHCDINFDPFLFMQDRNKVYGWTITMYEFDKTIPSLWGHVRDFIKLHPEHIAKDNALGFMTHDNGERYNLCHFWSNFEIADMNFWRGKAYQDFFEYLDSKGGFYYERWGDAPVHSIAAGLFAHRDQLHFFEEIGYEHNPYTHCPKDPDMWRKNRCGCEPSRSFGGQTTTDTRACGSGTSSWATSEPATTPVKRLSTIRYATRFVVL